MEWVQMSKGSSRDMALARQARLAALVMSVTIVAWVVLPWIGSEYDWPVRYAFLIDFGALAGFAFALIITFRVWRQGRNPR